MDAFELATKLGGEVVNDEARVRIDGSWVTLAVNGQLTEEGLKQADALKAKPKKKAAAKKATETDDK